MALTRDLLRSLAETRLSDATLLLDEGRHSSAYYLAGYAVELGLKACISRQIDKDTIPDVEILRNVLKHDVRTLVGLAGLGAELEAEKARSPGFTVNWALVAEWRTESRYEIVDATSARLMVDAIAHVQDGVLPWIRKFW